MEFVKIEPADIPMIKPYLDSQEFRSCDYTVNTIFMWRDFFNYRYSIASDCLVIRGTTDEGYDVFAFPVGDCEVEKALLDLWECCQKNEEPLRFMTVPKAGVEILKQVFKEENLDIMPVRKWYDYVYDVEQLATLRGKKNARHRNQINKFKRLYPQHAFHKIESEEDREKIQEFLHEFTKQQSEKNETGEYELSQVNDSFEYFFELGFHGSYLTVGGKVVAATYGSIIQDTLFVHMEKALRAYEGSYAMINHLFAQEHVGHITYVNREDDSGDLGLRYAKESYNPVMMIEKFNVDVLKK